MKMLANFFNNLFKSRRLMLSFTITSIGSVLIVPGKRVYLDHPVTSSQLRYMVNKTKPSNTSVNLANIYTLTEYFYGNKIDWFLSKFKKENCFSNIVFLHNTTLDSALVFDSDIELYNSYSRKLYPMINHQLAIEECHIDNIFELIKENTNSSFRLQLSAIYYNEQDIHTASIKIFTRSTDDAVRLKFVLQNFKQGNF